MKRLLLFILIFCTMIANAAKEPPLLLANYYVWYHDGTNARFPWAGWTRPTVHTNQLALAHRKPDGPPVASAAYPLAGLYDSADPVTADWHIRLAQAAGIDAFLIDWWDIHKGRDKNADTGIIAAAKKHNFKFALLDERAQFHNDFEWYKQSLVKNLNRYKNHPCYLKIEGRPVIYLYQVATNAKLTPAKFTELKDYVESETGAIYWIVDKIAHNHAAQRSGDADKIKHIPADWLETRGIDCFAFYSTFSNFRAHKYEDLIGKYRHIAELAHNAGKKIMLPVHPGHNNSHFRNDHYIMPHRDGQTLRDYLQAAKNAGADYIMITSWNEWPETTVIEPASTWEDPYRYLKIIAEFQGVSADWQSIRLEKDEP